MPPRRRPTIITGHAIRRKRMSAIQTASDALERLAAAFDGTLAVAARNETTGETLALNAGTEMPTASTIKLAVLVAVFERVREGSLSLDERRPIRDEERVGGSGVIKELSAGTELTIRDLATYMVVVSDNMATNLLIDAAGGVESVNRFVNAGLGLTAITLRRKLMFTGGRGHLAVAAPRDLAELVSGIQAGRIVSPEASEEMLGMLARQQYLDQVPRLFDRGELVDENGSEGRIRVACKTGMIDGVRADVGVVWLDGRPVSYAVMSEADDDRGLDLDAGPQLVNAEVGWILVQHLWPADSSAPPALASHPAAAWSRLHAAAVPAGSERSR
jgi:beta-lactamase class A